MSKNMTLRLDEHIATDLELVAEVDGQAVAETVRIAIVEYIERRRIETAFQQNLRTHIDRMRRLLPARPRSDDEAFLFEKGRTFPELDPPAEPPSLIAATAEEMARDVMERNLLDPTVERDGAEERFAEALPDAEAEAWTATMDQVRAQAVGRQEIILKNPLGQFDRFPGDEPPLPFTEQEGNAP